MKVLGRFIASAKMRQYFFIFSLISLERSLDFFSFILSSIIAILEIYEFISC